MVVVGAVSRAVCCLFITTPILRNMGVWGIRKKIVS